MYERPACVQRFTSIMLIAESADLVAGRARLSFTDVTGLQLEHHLQENQFCNMAILTHDCKINLKSYRLEEMARPNQFQIICKDRGIYLRSNNYPCCMVHVALPDNYSNSCDTTASSSHGKSRQTRAIRAIPLQL